MTKKQRNRSGGPATPRGRARASANAARHGLQASRLLLPGEQLRAYLRHHDDLLLALKPMNRAEARLALNVGDVTWRIGRWLRVEHHANQKALEDIMKQTAPYALLSEVRDALKVLSKLIEVAEQVPVPAPELLDSFIAGCKGGLNVAERVSQRPRRLAKFRHAVDELENGVTGDDWLTLYRAVADAAVELTAELTRMVKPAEASLKKLRDDLGALTTPDEKTMKRLGRYHSALVKVAADELDLIVKMREVAKRKRAEKRASSFGTGETTRAAQLLRVVK